MTLKYKVIWANIAETDLASIIGYIANDSLPIARKIFAKIKKKAASRTSFPERGRIVPELQEHSILQYRELSEYPDHAGFHQAA